MNNTTAEGKQSVSKTAAQFIYQAKQATKRRYTAEDKIQIIIEGMKREIPVHDLCRWEGIATSMYYSWLKDFMEAGKARLKGDVQREANRAEVQKLHQANDRLKMIVADQTLEIHLLKKSLLS